ncbi:MAG: hypothetical protein AB7O66_19010 [Limisphaerales bacterium]
MSLEHRILERGADDWMYLAEVASLVREAAPKADEAELRAKTLGIVRNLAGRGLLVLGDLSDPDGGFKAWTAPIEASMERIRTEWEALGTALSVGDVCWLANTPAGDAWILGEQEGTTSDPASPTSGAPAAPRESGA